MFEVVDVIGVGIWIGKGVVVFVGTDVKATAIGAGIAVFVDWGIGVSLAGIDKGRGAGEMEV